LKPADFVTLLLHEAKKTRAPKLLLSAEAFSANRKLEWLAPVSKHFDIVAHFYLRRQDDWLMSWYNQNVKWPFNAEVSALRPDQFLARGFADYFWLDYQRLAELWGKNAQVRFSVFEKGHIDDVVEDFCRVHGIDSKGLEREKQVVNDSLPPEAVEMIRRLNEIILKSKRAPLASPQRRGLIDAVRRARPPAKDSKNPIYSLEQREKILARFAASNAEVARTYFERDQLFAPPEAAEAPFNPAELDPDKWIKQWIGPTILELAAAQVPDTPVTVVEGQDA
jgi:hypothetical protein